MRDRHVFACHRDRWDTIYYSELGSSLAILNAGYNLDCLMLRYQGIDWRNKATWGCNARCAAAGCVGLNILSCGLKAGRIQLLLCCLPDVSTTASAPPCCSKNGTLIS